jgi:hypothetical protein
MRILGIVLVVAGLAAAALAASTAYLAPLDLPAEELTGLTLSAPAGKNPDTGKPIASPKQTLTADLIARLQQAEVTLVRVSKFSVDRWPGRWAFAGAVIGLLAGAALLRCAARRVAITAATGGNAEGPLQALQAIRATIEELSATFKGGSNGDLGQVLVRIGALQQTHMPAFVEARPALVARLGLGGFAELMDRYAAAERQINRAWSAAADGAGQEAAACLGAALALLDDAATRLV